MCGNKAGRPTTQTCIKSLNCQPGKHQLTPATSSRQGTGQGMLFINNLQDGIHPHTHSLAIQVSTVQGNAAYSPILFYISEQCQKKLKKQFIHQLVY